MLAAALNYIGAAEGQKFARIFAKSLEGFIVIEVIPDIIHKESRLQLCQPESYKELQKYLQKRPDPDGTHLILHGPKDKILRSVRHMIFFDEEKKYSKVLLEGANGIKDFAWALQIAVVQPPVPVFEKAMEQLLNADIIILNGPEDTQAGEIVSKIKKIRQAVPFFAENIEGGLSRVTIEGLDALFDDYLEKRWTIKDILKLRHPERQITCVQARSLAGNLGVSSILVGSVCDELGYSITRCGLGCF